MTQPLRHGLVAKKIGMTRVYNEQGRNIPVTVMYVENLQVIAQRTPEKNGYTAIQVGAFVQKAQRLSKPVAGHFRKAGVEAKRHVCEFRMDGNTADQLPAVGTTLTVEHFQAGQMVDVSGLTKGRGFAGVIKRWNFASGRATHGNSLSHRIHGATGSRQDPGRVFKNKKMAGHLGNENVTIQNLEIVRIDVENSLILLKGSVPGNKGSIVTICDAVKAGKSA